MAGNSFYGRAFVFLEGTVPDGHAGVFNARGTLPGGGDVEFRLGIGHGALEPNYSGPGNEYGIWTPSPPPMPADRWTCIEWYYGDDPGDADQLHYWIDGIEQVDHGVYGATPSLWTAPSYATFSFGLLLYHDEPGAGFDLWFDAVALSSARIGCGD